MSNSMAPSSFPRDICGSRGNSGPSLLERSPRSRAYNSVIKSLTQASSQDSALGLEAARALMLTRQCFLSLGFHALPPWSCAPPVWQGTHLWTRGWQTPFWWWASTGTGSRLLLFIELHSCGNWILPGCQKWGECFSLGKREDSFSVNELFSALWIFIFPDALRFKIHPLFYWNFIIVKWPPSVGSHQKPNNHVFALQKIHLQLWISWWIFGINGFTTIYSLSY